MGRWYCTREAVKRALGEQTPSGERDKVLDQKIEAASREIEGLTHRIFIPETRADLYPWPQRNGRGSALFLSDDLLAVTSLTKDGTDVTAIASTDYFLEPSIEGPPYHRIEIDLASSAFFSAKDTHQRAITVTGRWGYSEDTEAAGALAAAITDAAATTCAISDSSLVGIGDTLKIGTEQAFVTAKALLTTGTTLNDTLTALKSDTLVTVASGAAIKDGEIITLDSERMFVESISGNDLTVIRGYDGSTLASHSTGITVYAPRTLTIVRGVNGTTAATALNAAAVSRYVAPYDVVNLCEAIAIFEYMQSRGGRTGVIGTGEGAVEITGRSLAKLREGVRRRYLRHAVGAV